MKKVRHLPKEKQVKRMEEQDKILAGLPDPHKEEKLLKRLGAKLKHMIRPKKVKISEIHRIEKEVQEAGKSLKEDKKKARKKPLKKKVGKNR